PDVQRFVTETQNLARTLRSQYRVELQRELIAGGKLTAIHGDAFWSKAGPLAIAALLAVLAVVGAVVFSSNESRISTPTGSSLSRDLVGEHANQFAPVEAEAAARLGQDEKVEADAGPSAFTAQRTVGSVLSSRR